MNRNHSFAEQLKRLVILSGAVEGPLSLFRSTARPDFPTALELEHLAIALCVPVLRDPSTAWTVRSANFPLRSG